MISDKCCYTLGIMVLVEVIVAIDVCPEPDVVKTKLQSSNPNACWQKEEAVVDSIDGRNEKSFSTVK